LSGVFLASIFLPENQHEMKKNERGPPTAQTRPGGTGPRSGRATQAYLAVDPPMSFVFALDLLSWIKNSYIKTPQGVPRGGSGETRNQKAEVIPAKIGGGNATGVAPGRFSNLSNITNTATMMKREYSTSELWVCGSSLFYLSLVLWCLDAMWAGQHEMDILCNSYMVDPYFIGWSMRSTFIMFLMYE
jgi:hypothetical protein